MILFALALAMQMVGTEAESTYADGILVTTADVTTCPYKMVSMINVGMNMDYGGGHNAAKNFAHIREKAKAIGADAVVLVTKGTGHMTLFAFTHKTLSGRAIRYVNRDCAPRE